MGSIITELREKFRRGDVCLQLIYINVGVFVLVQLAQVLLMLFNRQLGDVLLWLELPASFVRWVVQPWSLVTYMFLHVGWMHILFNMLWLYWFGQLFLHFFSARHLLGLYVLGGLCGGALYMLAFNVFPYFRQSVDYAFLLGASASVLAIVMAPAYRAPNFTVRLFLFGNVRLKYLALATILLDLLLITSGNAGGHIAHLGGALAGLWFAVGLSKGHDRTAWINRVLDALKSLVRPGRRKPKMKLRYGGGGGSTAGRQQDYDYNARKKAREEEVDRILEKLKKSGYESLTADEKKTLFDASKR